MKKKLICTIAAITIGAAGALCGDVVKANALPVESHVSSGSKQISNTKQAYLDKLDAIQEGLSDLDVYYAGNTLQMKYAAGEEYKRWDKALNEIFAELKKTLSPEEMKSLQQDQIDWMNFREEEARKAANMYKDGTAERLAYVSSLAESTKDRCYELVYREM